MSSSSIKKINQRIKSIRSTMQITKAMELVATSKLRKAKNNAEDSRPYFEEMYQALCDISLQLDKSSIYTKAVKPKQTLYIVIAGDRGLAGGYNSNIFKLVKFTTEEEKIKPKIISIGRKATEYFEKRDYDMVASYNGVADHISCALCNEIAENVLELFKTRKVDMVRIFYTDFVSPLIQQAERLTILPVPHAEKEEGQVKKILTEFEPDAMSTLSGIIPLYLASVIQCAVVTSYASEQAARRSAMENANKNGEEMIEKLSLLYNRARQSGITQEITEIVSGAGALK